MSQQPGGPAAGRAPGVAQVSALAVQPAGTRGIVGHFVVVGLILVALSVAGSLFVGDRVRRHVNDSFAALYDDWQQQDQQLEHLETQLRNLQRQLAEWGALDGTGSTGGVLVISREQAREVVQQLTGATSTIDSLRRAVSQRQATIGRTAEMLGRDGRASLWAVTAGILVAAIIGGAWLARASTRPVANLRRQLQLADQGQYALATALGPWFGRISEQLIEHAAEGEQHVQALEAFQARMDHLAAAMQRVQQEAAVVGQGVEEFRTLADRIREFGGESKVLALSAAIEGARMDTQGRGVAVVADELRRVADEARETVRQLAELENRLVQAAQAAGQAASMATGELDNTRRQALAAQEQARGLVERLKELHRRTRQAAQAATAWSSRGAAGRSSLDLRASVERALSGGAGTAEPGGLAASHPHGPEGALASASPPRAEPLPASGQDAARVEAAAAGSDGTA